MLRLSLAACFFSTAAFAAPPVSSLAYSPDGAALAAGTRGRVDILDPKSGAIVRSYAEQTERVTALAWSKSNLLAVASGVPGKSGIIKLYDSKATKPLAEITAHADAIYSLDFSPDGTTLASAGYDRVIHLWNAKSPEKPLRTLKDHSDAIYCVRFHPDGARLASAGADRTVKIWDVASGQRLYSLGDATDWLYALAWSRDGKRVTAAGVDKSIRIWDVGAESGKLAKAQFAHRAAVTHLLGPTADGELHSVAEDKVLKSWDAQTLKESRTYPAKPDTILSAEVSPDGKEIALGRFDGTLELIDAKTGMVQQTPLPAKDKPAETKTRYPSITVTGSTASARTAEKVARPATILGQLERPGETDHYRIDAQAGDELGFELIPATKPFDAILTLTDDAGNIVAESTNGLIGHRVSKAGTFAIALTDKEFRGGADFGYRLSIGPIPIITGVKPLAALRGEKPTVKIRGVNLGSPNGLTVPVAIPAEAAFGSRVPVPLPLIDGAAPLGSANLIVAEFPGTEGVLEKPGADVSVAFQARAGEPLAIEVHAARWGSKLDSVLEIRDARQKPVEQATLRSVSQTFTTFRDHDSANPGIRLDTWNELRTNDYLYCGSELMRIKAMPKNPDDDCQFVQLDGKRTGFRGTTPTHHAQNSPMYKVEFHPPGAAFPPNGLPVFPLHYRNDDGGAGFGQDSFLLFNAPSTGVYFAHVRDAHGGGSEQHNYRIAVRPARPDYSLKMSAGDPKLWKNAGVPITVSATRSDGFTGPIRLKFELPAGFAAPDTIIEAEQASATVALSSTGAAPMAGPLRVRGEAIIADKPVVRESTGGKPTLAEPGELATASSVNSLMLKPGGEVRLKVKIERAKGFAGRVPLDVRGLPHGVRVENIGLSGILVLPEESEREIVIVAEDWVRPLSVPIVISAKSEKTGGEYCAPPVVLNIRK